jgi:hypothetical protein
MLNRGLESLDEARREREMKFISWATAAGK